MSMQISISNAIGGGGGTQGGGTPPFSNVNSFLFDGVDEKMFSTANYTELNGSTNFSISFWIKPIGTNSNGVWEIETQGNSERLTCRYIGSQQRIYITFRSQSYYYGSAVNSVLLNQWSHIVYTYNASLSRYNRPEIYVNGALSQGTNSGVPYASSNFNGTLTFGDSVRYAYGNNYIDEFAVWNSTTLTQTQANELYNGGTPSDLNNIASGLAQPTTWFRMGEEATWNGFTWTMTDVNGGTVVRAANMQESSRTTDVPPNPFSNTLSTYFDGVDDRVEINRTLGSGYAELSISTWVKYNNNVATSNKYHPIVAKIGPSFGNSFALQNLRSGASSNGGELYFNVQTPNGSFTAFSGVVPSQNVWYNIVGTYDGSNVKIYIDGVLKGTLSASGNINSNNELMMLGDAGYGGYSSILNGNLDEVSVYSRGLTQSEVTDIFGQGVPSDVSSIPNIEAWLRMGDGDTANTIKDNVGSNNGTMVNMNASNFVTDVPTFSKKSIALDGVDDYVNCGTNLALLGSATTFSAWIKMTDATSFRVLHKGIAGNREYAFGVGTSDTLFLILYNGSTNYIGKVSTSTMTSYQGQWIHICATYDGSTNASGITLYVNGSVFNSNSISGGSYTAPSGNSNGNVYIGRYNTEYADGNIDEVSVFNLELSQSDVTSIYNGGVPNDISSLSPLSWWKCGDGDTAPILSDNGSGGNDGTMTNFTTFSTDVPT